MRHINYPAPMTTTLAGDAQDWTAEELLARTRFATGALAGITGYGIIEAQDPESTVPNAGRPFTISPSITDLSVNMQGGTVVFGNGEIVTIPSITNIGVSAQYLGERHVLYLVFTEEGHDVRPGDDDVPVPTWTGYPASPVSYLRIARKVDYDIIPLDTRQETIVALAVITPTTQGVSVDHTRTELAECRPWATSLDIQHRSYVGTGTPTERNPHGQTIGDFDAAEGLSLYAMMLPHGCVIAADVGIAGIPGRVCSEVVPNLGIHQDVDGMVTGYINAYYFRASKFPVQMLKCVDDATQTKEIALAQIPRQNLLFFMPNDEWTAGMDLYIEYAAVDAAAPPTGANLTVFEPGQPLDGEYMISDGQVVPAVTGSLSFATMGPYPCKASIYLDGNGSVRRTPETLKCDISLNVALGLQATEIQPSTPSKIRVGLRGAIAGPSMSVVVRVTGSRTDDGAQVSEDLTFDSTWTDSTIPALEENANQWLTTTTTFDSIDSYSVVSRVSDGPLSYITIQAISDVNDSSIVKTLPIADVFWDGLKFASITDTRELRVAATSAPEIGLAAATYGFAESTLLRTTAPHAIVGAWYDDFDAPSLAGTVGTTMARWSHGLGASDVYTSRPIVVRPHDSSGVALRIHPVSTATGFMGWVRVFTEVENEWSDWQPFTALTVPKYSVGFAPNDRLVKFQYRMRGPVKGAMIAYIATDADIPATMVFDSGAYGIDTLG